MGLGSFERVADILPGQRLQRRERRRCRANYVHAGNQPLELLGGPLGDAGGTTVEEVPQPRAAPF